LLRSGPSGRRGFEVLGFDGAAGFDSFRCNALESDFERLNGKSATAQSM